MKTENMKGINSKSIESSGLKIISFFASWSSPCITQFSILERLAEKLNNSIVIERIDIDAPENDPEKYDINAVPTLCLVRNGKEIRRFIGVQQLETLMEELSFQKK